MSDIGIYFCTGILGVCLLVFILWCLFSAQSGNGASTTRTKHQPFCVNRMHWYNAPGMNSYEIELLISSATDFVYVYAVTDEDVTDFIRFSTKPPKDKDIVIEGFKKIPDDVMRIGLKCSKDVKSLDPEERETMRRYMVRGVAKIKKDYLDERPIEARQEICDIMNFLTQAGIWCEFE